MTSPAAQDIQENQAQESAPQDVETPPSGRPGPATTPLRAAAAIREREPWLALAALVVLGGLSGAAYYLGFVRPYLLEQYFATPLLDLAKINGHTAQSANAWGLTWLITFACYYLAFRLCPPSDSVTRLFRRVALFLICGWATFFAINLIFMYPVGAADLFDQIFRARLTVHYGFNPFTTLPNSIQGDPFQAYVAWRGDPSPYGPMWEALAAGASWLGGDSLWRNLVTFKVLVSVAYGIGVALTYGILREIRTDWALRGTLFFAWNPLVLFEVAGNGHNDAIVIMFMLAGIYFLVKGWRSAVLPALTAGALTKFIPVLLVPVAAAAIWRDRLRKRNPRSDGDEEEQGPLSSYESLTHLAVGAILSLGLALVLYAPFWTGPESVLPRNRATLFTASIPKVVLDTLINEFGMRDATAQALVRNVAYGVVALVALGFAVYIFRMRNADTVQARAVLLDRTLRAFYEIIFVYLVFAALWFQPWYLMWLVALTAPVVRYTYANRTLLFCLGGIANYFVWDYIWLWNRTDIRTNQVTAALAIYSLPLLYTLYVWLRPIWDKRDAGERGAELAPAHTGG